MKTNPYHFNPSSRRSASLKALLCAMLLSGATVTPIWAESHAPVHSVTGSGLTAVPKDFWFPGSQPYFHQTSISARQEADGTVKGSLILQDWSDTREGHFIAVLEVNCLSVTENTAYFGAVILWSTDQSFAPPGTEIVGYVTDKNGAGSDLSWFGPAFLYLAPDQDCSARPAIRQVPIASGNFIVR